MRLSIHLVLVGVGAWVAFSNVASGRSETMPPQAQNSPSSPIVSLPDPALAASSAVQQEWWVVERSSLPQRANSEVAGRQPAPETIVLAAESTRNRSAQLLSAAASPSPTAGVSSFVVPSVPDRIAPPVPVAQVVDPTVSIPDKPLVRPAPSPGTTPSLNQTLDIPDISPPIGPAKLGPAPAYLNPDPNPLLFPTRRDEVKLRGVQPITLRQAIELAERNSRTLQISVQQLERSRAGLREQKASLYPSLNVQSGITTSQSASGQLSQAAQNRNPSIFQTSNSDRNSTSFSGSLNLDYSIFTFGLRPAQIRAAEQQVRSDELQVEIAREQLRSDVATDYYSLQEADESVRIAQVAIETNRINLRDAVQLRDAGLGTQFSVLQADVELANARQQLSNAVAQVQIRRRQLSVRIAAPLTIDLATADPIQVAGTWNLTLDDSIIMAVKNRAELEQFLVQRNLSAEQRKAALAQLAPTINLTAQYSILDSYNDSFGLADGYSATLGLRWNFFDGGAARARADQQSANIAIAELNFADGRDQVRFQVEQSYANLIATSENVSTTGQAVVQAREAVRLAFLRREAGVGTELEVRNAISNLTQAQGNRVNAILGYNRALTGLQRAVTNLPPGTTTLRSSAIDPAPTATLPPAQSLRNLPRSSNLTPIRTNAAGLLSNPTAGRGTLP